MECGQRGRYGCEGEQQARLKVRAVDKERGTSANGEQKTALRGQSAHLKSVKLQSKTRDQNLTARGTKEKRTCIRVTTKHQNKTRCQRAVRVREKGTKKRRKEGRKMEERKEGTKE